MAGMSQAGMSLTFRQLIMSVSYTHKPTTHSLACPDPADTEQRPTRHSQSGQASRQNAPYGKLTQTGGNGYCCPGGEGVPGGS
jgi:hypothetical protein